MKIILESIRLSESELKEVLDGYFNDEEAAIKIELKQPWLWFEIYQDGTIHYGAYGLISNKPLYKSQKFSNDEWNSLKSFIDYLRNKVNPSDSPEEEISPPSS
ncbi:MAG: hypothetical protein JXA60_03195 [Candidatus Coatesbacteria bacterium]|nr:hypothetical protein [Candidatus Coatesbacteria bacterium]